MTFQVGDRVRIAGPPGEVFGKVMVATTPDEMPHLGPGSRSGHAIRLLREMSVDAVLFILHPNAGRDVAFFAVHKPSGWADLKGQPLTITKVVN